MDIEKLRKKADNYRNNAKTKEAIKLYLILIDEYEKIKEYSKAGHMIQMIGVSYKIDNDTKNSLQYLDKAYKYYLDHGLKFEAGDVLRDIGITYEYIDDLKNADKYLKKSAKILKNDPLKYRYGITLAKIGYLQVRQGDLEKAEKTLQEALNILETTDHWFFTATTYLHLSQFYFEKKDYSNTLKTAKKSEDIFNKNNAQLIHKRRYAQIWGLQAVAYANLGELDKAKKYLHKSLNILLSDDFSVDAASVVFRDMKLSDIISLFQHK